MKTPAYFIYRLLLMWMFLFMAARAGFLLMLYIEGVQVNPGEGFLTFLYGLRLDLSTCGYLTGLPALFWILYLITGNKMIETSISFINITFIILTELILFSNYSVYLEWGTIINARAIDFLSDPKGIWASVSTVQLISKTMLLLFSIIVTIKCYSRFIMRADRKGGKKGTMIPTAIALLLIPVMIRGGIQEIPINESAASFSENIPINDAATNPVWFLVNNISKRGTGKKNPYLFTPEIKSREIFSSLFTTNDSAKKIIAAGKPNIILIVLESWTSGVIAPLGGDLTTTPYFTSLCDSGLLFTGIYSSGRRTDQMFPSVLSGFPSVPNFSISRFSDKIRKLPILSADLRQAGYHTSFFYGGELQFANMNSYLLQGKFQNISGKNDYNTNQLNSKWGAHDEFVFDKILKETSSYPQPFFNMVLTLSTHEPFEVPGIQQFPGNDEPEKFRNSAFYTDQCLKRFFEQAKEQPWYSNTLFILVADHGHLLPQRREYYDPEGYHIPLLWYGEVMNDSLRGKQIGKIAGQHDLATTLLTQLNLPAEHYIYSRDLLKSYLNEGTYLNFDKGFGWLEREDRFVYLFSEKQFVNKYTHFSPANDSISLTHGKVFLQSLYGHFILL